MTPITGSGGLDGQTLGAAQPRLDQSRRHPGHYIQPNPSGETFGCSSTRRTPSGESFGSSGAPELPELSPPGRIGLQNYRKSLRMAALGLVDYRKSLQMAESDAIGRRGRELLQRQSPERSPGRALLHFQPENLQQLSTQGPDGAPDRNNSLPKSPTGPLDYRKSLRTRGRPVETEDSRRWHRQHRPGEGQPRGAGCRRR
jgi:hypothetical protein